MKLLRNDRFCFENKLDTDVEKGLFILSFLLLVDRVTQKVFRFTT